MASRIIVDKIDGVHHIYSDNGGNMLQAEGTYHLDRVVHAVIVIIINNIPRKFLTDLDVIEFKEINGHTEKPVEIIKMSEYLSKGGK